MVLAHRLVVHWLVVRRGQQHGVALDARAIHVHAVVIHDRRRASAAVDVHAAAARLPLPWGMAAA